MRRAVLRRARKNVVCCILAVLMVLDPEMWCLQYAAGQAPAQPAQAGGGQKLDAKERERLAKEMERGFEALAIAQKEIPREAFDVQALAAKMDKDATKLFTWVRDNTYWAPYSGALRGPAGVLMDRLGSSLDRALLLADLLRAAGHDVRLTRAVRSADQAKEFLQKVRPIPSAKPAPLTPANRQAVQERLEKYATQFQLDAKELRQGLEKSWLEMDNLVAELARRLEDQAPRLAKAIGPRDKQAATVDAAVQKASTEHWWVQMRQGQEWVNLDPSLPDAQAGGGGPAPATTLTPFGKDGKLTLDSALCHEVTISLVVEQWKDGKLIEHTVLRHAVQPFAVLGERIAVQHCPVGWPDDFGLFMKGQDARLKKVVLESKEWLPVLTVGGRKLTDASFADNGDMHKKGLDSFASLFEKGITGFDPFKKFKPPPKSGPGQLTAEWLQYDVRCPGQPTRTMRRQTFDLLGPAARALAAAQQVPEPAVNETARLGRGLALLGSTEILVQPCQLAPEFVEDQGARSLLANRKTFPDLLRLGSEATEKELKALTEQLTPLPGLVHALALARFQAGSAGDCYLDRPNILSFHVQLSSTPQGELLLRRGLDIVANEVAARPAAQADSLTVRLRQGIIDTNLEALLMSPLGPVDNTGELFKDAGSNSTWLTVRTAEDAAWQKANLPKDARARIAKDLADGFVVVVPASPVERDGRERVGWWRIDPRTGDALGIGELGWGQNIVERILTQIVGTLKALTLLEWVVIVVVVVIALGVTTGFFQNALRNGVQSAWNNTNVNPFSNRR